MEFVDQIECYEAIAELLRISIKEPWDSIFLKVELYETSVNLESSYSTANEKGKEFLADYRVAECFYDLARLISTPEKGFFKKCVFTLTRDGRYKIDFEY